MTQASEATEAAEIERLKKEVDDRIKTPDRMVVDRYLSKLPLPVRVATAEMLRPMLLEVIERERNRCVDMLAIGVRFHQHRVGQAEAQITAAIAGGSRIVDQLAMERHAALACVRAVETSARVIAVSPGTCHRCGGAQMVPTGLVGPAGQPVLVACPACGVKPSAGNGAAPG